MIQRQDIPEDLWRAMRIHALNDYPREACGVVIQLDDESLEYVPIPNVHPSPTESFMCCKQAWADAADRGQIVVQVHSHPDASSALSPGDRRFMEEQELPWAVVSVISDPEAPRAVGDISWNVPTGYQFPLIGREFSHGILDCFTLLRDYYKWELGITLPDFPREDKWWEMGQNLYVEQYGQAGFIQVPLHEIEKHDIILMQVRAKVPNHAAIYIGNSTILHHLYGRLSTREIFGGYWLANTTHVLRYSHGAEAPNNQAVR